jgi:hypothetical protein
MFPHRFLQSQANSLQGKRLFFQMPVSRLGKLASDFRFCAEGVRATQVSPNKLVIQW